MYYFFSIFTSSTSASSFSALVMLLVLAHLPIEFPKAYLLITFPLSPLVWLYFMQMALNNLSLFRFRWTTLSSNPIWILWCVCDRYTS